MKQEKQDRRSRRTRSLVQSAMMELLLEKRYDAITVRDILERAGIGSSTFYAHYFDKEDVQSSLIEQMLEQLSQNRVGQEIFPSLALLQHIQEHFPHFQAIVRGHVEEQVWELVQATLSKTIEQRLADLSPEKRLSAIPSEIVAQYLTGAFLNLLKWWIRGEMPYSPERMDEIFWQMAQPIIP